MLYVKRVTIATVLLTSTLIFFTACNQAAPAQLVTSASDKAAASLQTTAKPASVPDATPETADNTTASNSPSELPASLAVPPVQIIEVHARGTLSPMSCCNQDLIERDEFVAIRNATTSPQDIRGWTLKNITKGYPTFTFPDHFPCVAYNALPTSYPAVPGGYDVYRQITP
ncbi:MAG: hypothetical protein ACYDHZ_03645, partial [Dehalococcoidia bacterium]